jgi:hypothetical protein
MEIWNRYLQFRFLKWSLIGWLETNPNYSFGINGIIYDISTNQLRIYVFFCRVSKIGHDYIPLTMAEDGLIDFMGYRWI